MRRFLASYGVLGNFTLSTLLFSEKIIIQVPYKIHNHHHTHTNYKIITLPGKGEKKSERLEKPKEKEEVETEAKDMLSGGYEVTEKSQPKKLRALITMQESTHMPLLSLLGINDVFAENQHRPLRVLHENPILGHLVHTTMLPHLVPKYNDQDYQFSDGTSYVSSFNHKPSLFRLPRPVPDVNQGLSSVHSHQHHRHHQHHHHGHTDFGYSNHVRNRFGPTAASSTSDPLQPGRLTGVTYTNQIRNHFGPTAASSTSDPTQPSSPGPEYEHVGYLVVDNNDNHNFVGMNHRDYSRYGS